MLHPGPGPFAAGPGPSPARKSPPSSSWAATAAVEMNMTAAAAAAINTGLARLVNLLVLMFFPLLLWLFIAVPPSVNMFPPKRPSCTSLCVTCMIHFSFVGYVA